MQNGHGSARHLGREALAFAPYMVEDLAEMVFLADPDLHIFYANPTASAASGYQADELLGLPVGRLLDADEELACDARRCMQDNVSTHFETFLRRKDDSRFPVRVTLSPLRADGGAEGLIFLVIDETGRLRAEQAVQLSQATLHSIDVAAPFGIAFVRNRLFLEANDRFCQMIGYDRAELIGHPVRSLYPTEAEYNRVGRELYGEIATSGFGVVETQWVRKDGSQFDVLLSASVRDPADLRSGITLTAMDITESKRTERAVRRSEAMLRSIFLAAPIAIGVVVNRVIQAVNDRMCDMVGLSRHELVGRSARVVYASQEEYDRVGRLKYQELAAGGSGVIETQWRHKDGRIIDVLLSSTQLDPDDPGAGVTFTALDITEHKRAERALRESEERFRGIVMRSPLGMLLYDFGPDRRLTLVDANPAAGRIFGVDCRQFLGRPAEDVFPNLIGHDTAAILYRAAREGASWGPAEQLYEHDGVKAVFEIHILQTSPSSVLLVARDVTAQKHIEDQLRQAQKMEAIGRLAGGVAHDFNNQLTVIKGYCDLLLYDATIQGVTREALTEIRQAAARAAGLTGQLLAFSRRQVLRPVVLNLNDVIAEIESPLRRIIGENIHLQFVPAPDLGNVRADRSLVEQAVMNLVINARDAMPHGGRITIETANLPAENRQDWASDAPAGECVLLAVTDTGIGMDEATRQRIFEPFFTTKPVGKGTGLGLSMVYGFV